jgi:hypothetical protein
MADYRIVCVEKDHGHIVAVGTGTDPDKVERMWSATEVRKALKARHTFHTVGSDDKKAYVQALVIIRTRPDHLKNDNLDNLTPCR